MKDLTKEEALKVLQNELERYNRFQEGYRLFDLAAVRTLVAENQPREVSSWVPAYPKFSDVTLVMCEKCYYQCKKQKETNYCPCCGRKMIYKEK